MDILRWADLQEAANDTFNIWSSGSDLAWAKQIWTRFEKTGFCGFASERERHVAIGRWMALASIYRDWCSIAFDEPGEDSPADWVEGLGVEGIYLGQLVPQEELPDDPDEAFSDAMTALLRDQREGVVKQLITVTGSGSDLFVSLWRSVHGPEGSDDEILDEASLEKVAAFQWISDGCPLSRS